MSDGQMVQYFMYALYAGIAAATARFLLQCAKSTPRSVVYAVGWLALALGGLRYVFGGSFVFLIMAPVIIGMTEVFLRRRKISEQEKGMKIASLVVVENATQSNVTGEKNWACIKDASSRVIIEATTLPKNNEDEWRRIRWSGDAGDRVRGASNRRSVSRAASKKCHVEASLGSSRDSLDIWILWVTIEIKTKGMRPANAAPFDPGTRDGSDRLGTVVYKSPTSSVLDEVAGEFVDNMGASAKVAPIARVSPKGVREVVKSGWLFEREAWSSNWIDGKRANSSNLAWTRDTSDPHYLRLTPDASDMLYDLDAPDIRWGQHSYETYNNFRQFVKWNNEACSGMALWCWQARWSLHRIPAKQITLNIVQSDRNIVLPSTPHFPAK